VILFNLTWGVILFIVIGVIYICLRLVQLKTIPVSI